MTQACGAPLKSLFAGTCTRPGRHGGRCKQHARPDPEEAKRRRMAEFAAQEARVDLSAARAQFLRASLAHGLEHPATRAAFAAYRDASERAGSE